MFNDSPDKERIPPGYDIKALGFEKDNKINVQNKLEKGTFTTRTVLFDPFTCYYEVVLADAKDKTLKLGGKELPKLNPEFDSADPNKEFSRTTLSS